MIEPAHQFDRSIPDDAIAVDEFFVAVAQERAHAGETIFEMKEYRSAAQERFEVTIHTSGKELVELF